MVIDTIERFELSFNGRSKTENCKTRDYRPKGELIALHLGLADVVTFRFRLQGWDKKKKSFRVISPGSTSQIESKKQYRQGREEEREREF